MSSPIRRILDRLTGGADDRANLVTIMAAVIPDDIDLADERTLISYLSISGFLGKEIDACLDDVIEKLRVQRMREAVLASIAGLFMAAALAALYCCDPFCGVMA